MARAHYLFSAIATIFSIGVAPTFAQNYDTNKYRPLSDETRRAVESLPELSLPKQNNSVEVRTLQPGPDGIPGPVGAEITTDASNKPAVPFVATQSVLLSFQPDATQAQIDDYLASKKISVIKRYPSLGSALISADLNKFIKPSPTDNSANDAILRGMNDAVAEYKKDPRVLSVAPNYVYSPKSVSPSAVNLTAPSNITRSTQLNGKATGWGIADIQADQLWPLDGAQNGAILGILDAGFAPHDDLTFLGFKADTPRADHGNHVSGIACGSHSNPTGVRGVLPHCFIRARYGDVFFTSTQGGNIGNFFVLFSQILDTLVEFVDQSPDVDAFNVSLGYNWISNFGVNPNAPDSSDWRSRIEEQSVPLVRLLRNAQHNGKVLFFAAGNDSDGLPTPVDSKYASAFNWATVVARSLGIRSGVIVEAHDKNGSRASFSNIGADLSCPGVDILSSIAYDDQHNPSNSTYGEMSGTSMASPYCAAGYVLFRLVRPKYTAEEALMCILASHSYSDSGTPMMRLKDALDACK